MNANNQQSSMPMVSFSTCGVIKESHLVSIFQINQPYSEIVVSIRQREPSSDNF